MPVGQNRTVSQWGLAGGRLLAIAMVIPGISGCFEDRTTDQLAAVAESVYGLESRPTNPDCVAPQRPTGKAVVTTEDVFPAATGLWAPTKILQAPGDPSRWFALEWNGRIMVIDVANPAAVTVYLDLSAQVYFASNSDGGLLGMAFHPDFPETPEIFLSYTAPTGNPDQPMVSTFSRLILDDPVTPGNVTEQVLLTVDQTSIVHKGGDIAFGPDGYLYIGVGDGGVRSSAQDTTELRGDMLRIDVLGVPWPSPGYNIPATNPFSASPRCGPAGNAQPCPEIYAWGFRNPWRWGFDAQSGALWLADVGESSWEEVDIVEGGRNYGWPCREGMHDLGTPGCPATGLTDPVSEYAQSGGASVTGGYVYRGAAIPGLQGRYVFGDYVSGTLWALKDDGAGGFSNEEIVDTDNNLTSFAVGEDGELYFTGHSPPRIFRLVSLTAPIPDTIPTNLAETGCAAPTDPTQPSPGMIPYTINAPFWSDGADKSRFLALPDGTTIDIDVTGDWQLPAGSVLRKDFSLGAQLIETRLLMRHPDGVWAGYTYEWNDAQTVATRVKGGKTRMVAGRSWIYPSEAECMQCHTAAAGFSLGLKTMQLNRGTSYPATGRTVDQLGTLKHMNLFSEPLADLPRNLPALPDPTNESLPLGERARAWLDTNCAQCHLPLGPTPALMDLRYETPLSDTNTCDVVPNLGNLDITDARLIAAGDATRSVIVNRVGRRDLHGMPPIGSNVTDSGGVSLVTSWVNSLTSCN